MKLNPQIDFVASETPVSEKQIRKFEAKIGFDFSSDYRTFLRQFNGPLARPSDLLLRENDLLKLTIDLASPDLPNLDSFDISWWMGFANPTAGYKYGIIERYEIHHTVWRLPKGIVAIGGSVGAGCAYLNLADDSRKNHVLLVGDTVVERQADDLEITSGHFVCVANSFSDFVSKLRWA
jgi:hypothetical protein